MRYRFGLFEFDDSQLVLRREQTVIRLQSQPARVLGCLVTNRERIVSRDELRRCPWGDSTFVDFAGGLNFCIAQVRSALGDDQPFCAGRRDAITTGADKLLARFRQYQPPVQKWSNAPNPRVQP